MTQLDRTLKRNVSLICTQLVFGCSHEFVRSIMSLLDLEGWLFGCCLSVVICSFYLFCLYRYECGLSCKLPLESFGIYIITKSGRIRNRRLYFDGLLRCIRCIRRNLFNSLTDVINISLEFSTSLLRNLLEQKGKYDNRPRYKYDISWILVCIREPKYRMDRTTPQPSPLLYFIFYILTWRMRKYRTSETTWV